MKERDSQRPAAFLHELPAPVLAQLLAVRPGTVFDGDRTELGSADWRSVFADAERHAVALIVGQRLAELDLIDLVPGDIVDGLNTDLRHARLQHALQSREALLVSEALRGAGVRHAFVKGFAYRTRLYDPPWVRLGGDVDLLVDRANIEPVRRLMVDLGFTQAKFSLDHQRYWRASWDEIAAVEAQHHELAEFNRKLSLVNPPDWILNRQFRNRSPFAYGTVQGLPVFHSSVDIHWALHFVFAECRPLDSVNQVEPGELPLLSVEWNVLFSLFKLYFEVFDRPGFGFTHLADLVALVSGTERVDWEFIDRHISRCGLQAAAFYTLSSAEQLLNKPLVPAALMASWAQITQPSQNGNGKRNLDFGNFVPFLVARRSVQSF